MEIDWSKAPKDATHFLPESEQVFASWIKPGFSMRAETQSEWIEDDDDTHEHEYVARPAQWNGEGLPAVGTVCEAKVLDGTGNYVWREAKVINHHPRHRDCAAIAHADEELLAWASDFRPIRTAEQIEADCIQKIRDEIGYQRPQLGICPVEAMYKLGYRKTDPS